MKLSNSISYSVILVSVSSVLAWCDLPIGNTTVWWLLDSWVLYNLYLTAKNDGFNNKYVNIFLFIVVFSFIYGAAVQAQNYWDWKKLISNLMVFLLPIASYAFRNTQILSQTLKNWYVAGPLILLIMSPFLHSDAYGKFLVPFTITAIWISIVPRKFILIILLAFFVCVTLGNQARSDMLKFLYCMLLGGSFFFNFLKNIIVKTKNVIWFSQILAPFLFLFLAATGIFNIFALQDELGLDSYEVSNSKEGADYNGLVDTRTFIYVEEITSAVNNNYVIFGRSMARGYDSDHFGDIVDAERGTSRGERQGCEVSILNIFNYFGLVGVIVYALIFIVSSYRAIAKSNNIYMPLLGIYVSFRWTFAFIEDFTKFDLNYMLLWVMIGMCFSERYRKMSNEEFVSFLKKCLP